MRTAQGCRFGGWMGYLGDNIAEAATKQLDLLSQTVSEEINTD